MRVSRLVLTGAFSVGLLITATVFGQNESNRLAKDDYVLSICGEAISNQKLTISDLVKLPRTKVRATPHNGNETEYEGVMVGEILKVAGQKFGESLRGKALATYLLVEADDGYQAVFALPELDSTITDKIILLADRQDNKELNRAAGPLQNNYTR